MRTIYKYALVPGLTRLHLPEGFRVLDVATQGGSPHLWAEVDLGNTQAQHIFAAVPTGGFVPENGEYLGTAHGVQDWMVFHIYKVTE